MRRVTQKKSDEQQKNKIEQAAKATVEFAGAATHLKKCNINDAYYYTDMTQNSSKHKRENNYGKDPLTFKTFIDVFSIIN